METRACKQCGKVLGKWQRVFCSDDCRLFVSRTRVLGACKVCGVTLKRPKQVYCSPECTKIGHQAKAERDCTVCGKPMQRIGKQRICSDECRKIVHQGHAKAMQESNRERWHERGTPRVCKVCGAVVTKRHTEYCSPECRKVGRDALWAARRDANPKHCMVCGKVLDRKAAEYCGNECSYIGRRTTEVKHCKTCGKEIDRNNVAYCSHACRDQARRNAVTLNCEVCGKPFETRPSNLNKGNRSARYCSTACAGEGKRLKGPGARYKTKAGYIEIHYPTHPDANKKGHILEHRLVAAEKYGRRLLPTEQVHHLNGIRDDNRPENLIIMENHDHQAVHAGRDVGNRAALEAELMAYREKYGPLNQEP